MPNQGKSLLTYLAAVILAGSASIAHAASGWQDSAPSMATAAFAALALAASCLKLRIPGVTGTISPGFIPVLTGVALMSRSDTVVIGALMALVQTYWQARRPVQPLHAAFNVSVLALSSWVAWGVAHFAAPDSGMLRVALAVAPLYLLNAMAVAVVLSLSAEGTLRHIWQRFQFTLFPYYVIGAILAALISRASQSRPESLLMLPLFALVYMTFQSYRSLVERLHRMERIA